MDRNRCPEAVRTQHGGGFFFFFASLRWLLIIWLARTTPPTSQRVLAIRAPRFICPGRRRTGVTNNMKDDSGGSLRRDSVTVSQHDRKQNTVSQLESSHRSAERRTPLLLSANVENRD